MSELTLGDETAMRFIDQVRSRSRRNTEVSKDLADRVARHDQQLAQLNLQKEVAAKNRDDLARDRRRFDEAVAVEADRVSISFPGSLPSQLITLLLLLLITLLVADRLQEAAGGSG